jgi:alkylation response protein AidB-like acyl-CoA dehydrogenase
METDARGYSPEIWQDIARLGWMGLVFPKEYGGDGLSFIDLVLLLEEMGRACFPGPFFSSVVLGGLPILYTGTKEQKQEFLPRIASGEIIASLAVSEEDVGHNSDYINVTAVQDIDHYIINGTKLFVPYAHVADYIICVSRLGGMRRKQIGLFSVKAKTSGMDYTQLRTISGDKQFEVVFSDVKVPSSNMLGAKGQSRGLIDRILQFASVAKCAEMIGGAQRVLEMAVDYAKERIQFGRSIGSFQAIQHYCANMLIDVKASRLITYEAAWMLSEGLSCSKYASVAKAWVGAAYRRVCMSSHQIHGAIGFTLDHDLQLYTRRSKAAELLYGDTDFHCEVVARGLGL